MPADPVTLALLGSQALGGLFGSLGGEGDDPNAPFNRARIAPELARRKETSPIRDRVLYALMSRLGASPKAFRGSALSGSGREPFSRGGVDLGQLSEANAAYTPGAGGVDPSIYDFLLESMGIVQAGEEGYLRHSDPRSRPFRRRIGPPSPGGAPAFDPYATGAAFGGGGANRFLRRGRR